MKFAVPGWGGGSLGGVATLGESLRFGSSLSEFTLVCAVVVESQENEYLQNCDKSECFRNQWPI